MLGGINPSQMQGMMKKMGISQEEISANRVIIEKKDGSKIIIEEPSVLRVKMQGQISFQISGFILKQGGKFPILNQDTGLIPCFC